MLLYTARLLTMLAQLAGDFVSCDIAISQEPTTTIYPNQMGVCLAVARAAREFDVEVPVVIALAWSESRFREDVVSSKGAFGPLQVTKFWCDNCADPVAAGVNALKTLKRSKGSIDRALCHYACGNKCSDAGKKYSKYIQNRAKKISSR